MVFALAVPVLIVMAGTLMLLFRFNIASEVFFKYIEKLCDAGDFDRALKLCSAAGDKPVARIIRKGLKMRLPGRFPSEDALADAAVETLLPDAEAESRRFMPWTATALAGVAGLLLAAVLPDIELPIRAVAAFILIAGSINIVRVASSLRRDVYAAVGVVAPFVQGEVAQGEVVQREVISTDTASARQQEE